MLVSSYPHGVTPLDQLLAATMGFGCLLVAAEPEGFVEPTQTRTHGAPASGRPVQKSGVSSLATRHGRVCTGHHFDTLGRPEAGAPCVVELRVGGRERTNFPRGPIASGTSKPGTGYEIGQTSGARH
jgi:hypothetical protein